MRKLKTSELQRISPEEYQQKRHREVVVVLDSVRSMNNVGSIFRSSDAFLIDKIFLCGITGKPPHREISKTAIGAEKSVPWEYFSSTIEAINLLKSQGYTLIAVEQAENSLDLSTAKLPTQKVAFIFGNEVDGVAQDVINTCDHCLEIPQLGTKHSFNVAVTCGMVLWEHFRQSKILLILLFLLQSCNQPSADSKQLAADSGQPSAISAQRSAISRQQTAESRKPSVDSRQPTADSRQPTAVIYTTFSNDCPICLKYLPTLREIAKNLPDSIDFKLVKVSTDEVWDFEWNGNLDQQTILDSEGKWCKKLDLNVYPETIILRSDGQKIYQGSIDDRAVAIGNMRRTALKHYLIDALESVKKGESPKVKQTTAVGCYIE